MLMNQTTGYTDEVKRTWCESKDAKSCNKCQRVRAAVLHRGDVPGISYIRSEHRD